MKKLEDISYEKNILVDDSLYYKDSKQRLYLQKSFLKTNKKDQFFLKVNLIPKNSYMLCQGYIYFYLDFEKRESKFIGTYVKPEYRNSKIGTNLKQRKPFLIYLLKNFDFEIENKSSYITSPYTIHICKEENTDTKCLLFKNKKQATLFSNSNIMKEDNYKIIDSIGPNIQIIDDVLLSIPYQLKGKNKAYKKALNTYQKHRM